MFEEGNIIYFDPFYFKNGNTAKPKYFVVLKNFNKNSILASLPTRKDTIPNNVNLEFGCNEISEININCFYIPKKSIITIDNKSFDFNTYLYGFQIDDYEINFLNEIYPNEGLDYFIWGKIKKDIFENLLECFKNSKSVKRKYKNIL